MARLWAALVCVGLAGLGSADAVARGEASCTRNAKLVVVDLERWPNR
jgi:hypothetical protein